MIDLINGRQVLVIGMGRSGLAAVDLLVRHGASEIIVNDLKKAEQLEKECAWLERFPMVRVVTGDNPANLITPALSLVIKSPGIPPSLKLLQIARENKVKIISEVELAYNFARAPMIGVTGSNGKTTTTALIAAMLKRAGFEPVVSAGNIGNPLSSVVDKVDAQGVIVVELSSFQLEDIVNFRPVVAVFLNIVEDHLDYHGSMENYINAKKRIFSNQQKKDVAVINAGDPVVSSLKSFIRGNVLYFQDTVVKCGVGLDQGLITVFNPGSLPQPLCKPEEVALPGQHNLENAMAAAAAAWAFGADREAIRATLLNFKSIEHRLEFVAMIKGVEYINDSKGTNPGSTIKALRSYPGRNKIIIAGGKDKKSDFYDLALVIKEETRLVLLIGETKNILAGALKKIGFNNYKLLSTLGEAVAVAKKEAKAGEMVILSPACASWDMFTDYEERGNLFKKLVTSQCHLNAPGGLNNEQ